MKRVIISVVLFFIFISNPQSSMAAKPNLQCKQLEQIFSTTAEHKDGICSVEIVRDEIKPMHMGKKMSPETMELVFHFAFEKVDHKTAVMGELALLEEEVNPVIAELQRGGLEVSALHNHMLHERPRILYVHFQGIGDMQTQALTIKKAIEKTSHDLSKKR